MTELSDKTTILGQVPIEITISVGRARPMVHDLLRLGRDSVLPLDRRIDDPVELFIGDRLIARGELRELDGAQTGYLGVRLTEIIAPAEKG
ncbi:MAG: FliM/FliN family flagellar motor switch protein [Roseinatronobacter sp.]